MKDTHKPEVKGLKMLFHANGKGKKAGAAVLTSDKIDFKTRAVVRDKERHYIMKKGKIKQEI